MVAMSLAQAGQSVSALEAARAIDDPDARTEALCTVAVELAQAGKAEEASKVLADALKTARRHLRGGGGGGPGQ